MANADAVAPSLLDQSNRAASFLFKQFVQQTMARRGIDCNNKRGKGRRTTANDGVVVVRGVRDGGRMALQLTTAEVKGRWEISEGGARRATTDCPPCLEQAQQSKARQPTTRWDSVAARCRGVGQAQATPRKRVWGSRSLKAADSAMSGVGLYWGDLRQSQRERRVSVGSHHPSAQPTSQSAPPCCCRGWGRLLRASGNDE